MIFTTASGLDNINYWNDPASTGDYTEQFVQGLNRNYGFWLTASKVGTGIIDITSSFGYVNEYYHADQPYGATEGLDDPHPPTVFCHGFYGTSSLNSTCDGDLLHVWQMWNAILDCCDANGNNR